MSVNGKCSVSSSSSDGKYELVPPEGGWGYVVCVGLSIIFIAGTSHQPVFGFIYNDFLEELGVGTGAVTLVSGVFQVTLAISGFATNIFLKSFSLRQVGLLGAFAYTLASFLAIFITSTSQLIITNGLLQGFAMGLLIPVAYTSFNSYFTRKKVLYLSLCKAATGSATMAYPLFVKFTMNEYGFRGTLAILCAISAHSIFGALVMQPVEWHMVKKMKPCEKVLLIQSLSKGAKGNLEFSCKLTSAKCTEAARSSENLHSPTSENRNGVTNIQCADDCNTRLSCSAISISLEKDISGKMDRVDELYLRNVCRAISASSLGNMAIVEPLPIVRNEHGKWQAIVKYLDLSILKDPVFDNIILGMSLAFFADLTFFTLEPLCLDRNHLTKGEIARVISLGGASDMAARLLLALAGQFLTIRSRLMFFTGALLTAVFRAVFVMSNSYSHYLWLTAIIGALRSLIHVSPPIVIAECVPIDKYPSAYGLYMLLTGFISMTVGPLIGFARDYTKSYTLAFNMLTVCNMCCVLPWCLECFLKVAKKKKTQEIETT